MLCAVCLSLVLKCVLIWAYAIERKEKPKEIGILHEAKEILCKDALLTP